ncbi:hypothetical protein BS50DRAFT_589520 [Corynespora cassiicola Philippines]|uniref:Uncharacterized protein n=1 Tax=Corynespora cassiicola Philippines TaxID=1448308 RepID=A0A2T2NI22_CORCC|nr:hypothetical protein BS50DRAFT_589520 [Corynespora cassiicola Philippines]
MSSSPPTTCPAPNSTTLFHPITGPSAAYRRVGVASSYNNDNGDDDDTGTQALQASSPRALPGPDAKEFSPSGHGPLIVPAAIARAGPRPLPDRYRYQTATTHAPSLPGSQPRTRQPR